MSGNVWEHVTSGDRAAYVIRGGSFYQDEGTNRLDNREVVELKHRSPNIGLRLCADVAGASGGARAP
jgi:hypothetical protein